MYKKDLWLKEEEFFRLMLDAYNFKCKIDDIYKSIKDKGDMTIPQHNLRKYWTLVIVCGALKEAFEDKTEVEKGTQYDLNIRLVNGDKVNMETPILINLLGTIGRYTLDQVYFNREVFRTAFEYEDWEIDTAIETLTAH